LVEFVDIYPTLCELAGMQPPQGLEGTSMAPLFDNPDRPWKKAAFSQFQRGFMGQIMGHTIRTDRYRYVEWRYWMNGTLVARELYDHEVDPQENVNIADRPENKELLNELAQILYDGWWKAQPQ
jgi:arylsulfatase A-like enzyme